VKKEREKCREKSEVCDPIVEARFDLDLIEKGKADAEVKLKKMK
jgi:hypothetical protein